MRVRTRAGDWQPLHSVLMPGDIVPEDGSRDDAVTVDTALPRTRRGSCCGPSERRDAPVDGYDVSCEPCFTRYRDRSESEYREQDLPANPWAGYLDFTHYEGVGPLTVLIDLSEEGRALYTDALLRLEACYRLWVMWHTGSNQGTYPADALRVARAPPSPNVRPGSDSEWHCPARRCARSTAGQSGGSPRAATASAPPTGSRMPSICRIPYRSSSAKVIRFP